MVNDIIADMLTRIRNASAMKYKTVDVLSSKMTKEIARILESEGYIDGFSEKSEGAKQLLTLNLKYGAKKERVINGLGIAIVSTSKGIMTDKEARKQNLGGEVLAYIW